MELEGIQLPTLATTDQRFSALFWGMAGCGKTTLAASAAGVKVWLNFDPDGLASLGSRDDIVPIDLSGERATVVDMFKTDDDPLVPLGEKKVRLSKVIEASEASFIVVDSVSAYTYLTLQKAISVTPGATLERPSPGAYGGRNNLTLRMMSALLALSKRMGINIIFITHEDDGGVKDKEGNILHITMLLGGKLASQVSLQISEVWYMSDDGKKRKVAVRPCRMRKPMKTRMFDATSEVEFELKYDPKDTFGKHSIAAFMKEWKDNGFNKIQVPK